MLQVITNSDSDKWGYHSHYQPSDDPQFGNLSKEYLRSATNFQPAVNSSSSLPAPRHNPARAYYYYYYEYSVFCIISESLFELKILELVMSDYNDSLVRKWSEVQVTRTSQSVTRTTNSRPSTRSATTRWPQWNWSASRWTAPGCPRAWSMIKQCRCWTGIFNWSTPLLNLPWLPRHMLAHRQSV